MLPSLSPNNGDNPDNEVCPNCGELVAAIAFNYDTGWCRVCSPITKLEVLATQFPATTYQKVENYLAIHANQLENFTGQGKSIYQAIDAITSLPPVCISCGALMKYAPRTAIFCRRTKICKRLSRRYVYLYTKKGLTKSQALAIILEELS